MAKENPIPIHLYLSKEEVEKRKNDYQCIHYDKKTRRCGVNNKTPECGGRLFNCSFFEVAQNKGIVVLLTYKPTRNPPTQVQSTFYLDACLPEDAQAVLRIAGIFEHKKAFLQAKGAYKYALSIDPKNEKAQEGFSRLEELTG
ncbi:MAG: hypothetical protein AABY05_01435 [Nanoarchaeota archaeon]